MSLLRNVNIFDSLGTALGSVLGSLKIALHDGNGNPVGSYLGAINVHDADVHRETVNRRFHRHTTPLTTLTIAVIGGTDYTITVASVAGFVIGDYLHIQNGNTELVHPQIKNIVGYSGELIFNTEKPDGTMVKLTDPSKLNSLGWKHTVELEDGIKRIYEWYKTK